MTIVRADVIGQYQSGLPRDVMVNTFHFRNLVGDEMDTEQFEAIEDALTLFYTQETTSISNMLSAIIKRSPAPALKIYDAQAEGGPLYEGSVTFEAATSSDSLPLEVALCSSYAAPSVAVPAGSKRGRIYLGPFEKSVISYSSSSAPHPSGTLIATIADASADLRNSVALGDANLVWCVYSRKLDQAMAVEMGWVDNEWDTQRRRQIEATSRTYWEAEV